MKSFIRGSFVALCLSLMIACSKQEPDRSILEATLLPRLPRDAAAFVVYDQSTTAAKTAQKQADSSSMADMQAAYLKELSNQPELKSVLEALRTAGLLTEDFRASPAIVEVMAFGRISAENLPEVGIALSSRGSADMREKLSALESVLKQKNISIQAESFGTSNGFSFALNSEDIPVSLRRFYLSADNSVLVLASSTKALSEISSAPQTSGFEIIRATPAFTQVYRNAEWQKIISFAYLDLFSLARAVSTMAPLIDGQKARAEQQPFRGMRLSAEVANDSVFTQALFGLEAKAVADSAALSAFSQSRGKNLLYATPQDSAVAISVDGSFLSALSKSALHNLDDTQRAAAAEQLKLLDSVRSVAIAVLPNAAASPFPDLLVAFESNDAKASVSALQTSVSTAIQQMLSGGGQLRWLEKDVGGTKVQTAPLPIGVSIGVATVGDVVVLGAPDSAVTRALEAVAKRESSLAQSLPGALSRGLTDNPTAVGQLYVSGPRLADVLSAVQGSLAMLTGGQELSDQESIDSLKSYGASLAVAQGEGDVVTLKLYVP